jgi:RNA-directed DNA polymerase
MKTSLLLKSLARKLRGHYNYFRVIGNLAGLHAIKRQAMEQLHKWLNQRSGRRSFTWERLKHYLTFTPLPVPMCRVKAALTKVRG